MVRCLKSCATNPASAAFEIANCGVQDSHKKGCRKDDASDFFNRVAAHFHAFYPEFAFFLDAATWHGPWISENHPHIKKVLVNGKINPMDCGHGVDLNNTVPHVFTDVMRNNPELGFLDALVAVFFEPQCWVSPECLYTCSLVGAYVPVVSRFCLW